VSINFKRLNQVLIHVDFALTRADLISMVSLHMTLYSSGHFLFFGFDDI